MNQEWTKIIESRTPLFELKLKQIWAYRDLVRMFVRRDLVVVYKQTILGPLWYIIQPLLSSVTFTIVFGKIAKIPTDGVPHYIFYLAGITCWGYFSTCLNGTSNTFVANQGVFGKVYFPRMVVPLSIILSTSIKFLIQLCVFLAFYLFYIYKGAAIRPNFTLFLLPLLFFMMAGLSLSFGMLFSSFTTKYRDLSILLGFFMQLWMYATPIIYPISQLPEKYRWIVAINPLTSIISTFKYGFFSKGDMDWYYLIYSFVFMIVLFSFSLLIFNKVEKNFIDTV